MKLLSYLLPRLRLFALCGRVILIIALMMFTFVNLGSISPVLAACTINGNVYRDYDASGTQTVGNEPGEPGIIVTAYAPNATTILAAATTDANGDYTLNITAPDGDVRVEFTGLPTYLRPGRFGTGNQSTTTTAFVNCAGGGAVNGINLAVSNPGEYCQNNNAQLATSCYNLDSNLTAPQSGFPAFVSFPNSGEGDPTPGVDDELPLAQAGQIGSAWGAAYQRSTDSFFVASYLKRHAGFGPNDNNPATSTTTTGGIYRITPGSITSPAQLASVTTSLFMIVPGTGADPHPATPTSCGPNALNDCWQYDTASYNLVSKMSLGDLDISESDQQLYTINLATRQLLIITIGLTPTPGAIASYALNTSTLPGTGCPAADLRPFGLGVKDERIYVGAVCSAESTQNVADLQAYVYSTSALSPGAFIQELTFPLDYPRRCIDSAPTCNGGARNAEWQPWLPTWPVPDGVVVTNPEPLLTDIVFEGDTMVLGFRDRFGDRTGNMRPEPFDLTSNTLFLGIAAGDTLRACRVAGVWTLESGGACGGIGPSGGDQPPFDLQGPGNGEFYFQDLNGPGIEERHDEITLGGLAIIPGSGEVSSTVFDPVPPAGADDGLFDGGVLWFNNASGGRVRFNGYRIFNSDFSVQVGNFGKTNGLGDLDVVCGPMPLEIGNRIWEDLDLNGVQDPGEVPLAGVIVNLYLLSNGQYIQVGTTTTNGAGEYYFNESNIFFPNPPQAEVNFDDLFINGIRDVTEPAGVLANRLYQVRLDDPANYGAGAPLDGYYITNDNTATFGDGNDDARDSDGTNSSPTALVSAANFPFITVNTVNYGWNNHTYDFGFAQDPPIVQTPTPVVGRGGGGLVIIKGVDTPFAAPGQRVVWTVTISNPTNQPIANVNITDPMPSTLQIFVNEVTDNSPTGTTTVNGQNVIFTQPVLAPGETVVITIPTRVLGNVPVPFEIINEIPGAGPAARASVLSVTRLPNTGESAWGEWRLPLLLLASLGIFGAAWALSRRRV